MKIEVTYNFVDMKSFGIIGYQEFAWWYNVAEKDTKKWVSNNIKCNWNIIDAGANIGIYTLPFSILANNGQIFAFEPTDTIKMLEENIKRYNLSNVVLINYPLGSKTEIKQDNIYKIWGSPPENKLYNFTTIDDFCLNQKIERLDLIKIDVDSYDYEVLLGAEKTLKKYDPYVIVELNQALLLRNHNPQEAIELMNDLGYKNLNCFDGENYLFKK
jgi:FkbM family methyltransferase